MSIKPHNLLTTTFALLSIASFSTATYAALPSQLNNFDGIDIERGASAKAGGDTTLRDGTGDLSKLERTIEFKIDNQSSSRAEIEREPQNSGAQSMGGKVKIEYGNRVSLIQVLNHKSGDSGTSQPAAQLAAYDDGTRSSGKINYRLYIVQGGTGNKCEDSLGNTMRIKQGSTKSIKMTYEKGKRPVFSIGGTKCNYNTTHRDVRRVGHYDDSDMSSKKNRYYYGKLGAYNTGGSTASGKVTWTEIYD